MCDHFCNVFVVVAVIVTIENHFTYIKQSYALRWAASRLILILVIYLLVELLFQLLNFYQYEKIKSNVWWQFLWWFDFHLKYVYTVHRDMLNIIIIMLLHCTYVELSEHISWWQVLRFETDFRSTEYILHCMSQKSAMKSRILLVVLQLIKCFFFGIVIVVSFSLRKRSHSKNWMENRIAITPLQIFQLSTQFNRLQHFLFYRNIYLQMLFYIL